MTSRPRGDEGVTLVELMVTLLLSALVLAVAGTVLVQVTQLGGRVVTSAATGGGAVVGELERQVRSATTVTVTGPAGGSGANVVLCTFAARGDPARRSVTWSAASTGLTSFAAEPTGTLGAGQVLHLRLTPQDGTPASLDLVPRASQRPGPCG